MTVATLSDTVFTLDVSDDLEIENFKAFCEVESGIPSSEIALLFNGIPLTDNTKSLKDYGITDGDMLMMDRVRQSRVAAPAPGAAPLFDFSRIQVPSNLVAGGGGGGGGAATAVAGSTAAPLVRNEEDPAWIRQMLAANPDQLALLRQNNPRLAEAYQTGTIDEFAKVLREQQQARREREQLRIRMMNADPFDLEAQRLIAKEIEQKNIDANMEMAMETTPESFGSVIMLYINCKVNGHDVKAFVDSGAQATIMSQRAAERCNIMRLVDQRWAGIAKGVGTQKIIGRVHMAQIQIEGDFLASSFSILEEQPMDMLLGLDMLKRHQCIIDLKRGVLVIGSSGTETRFLSEAELPPCARLSSQITEEDAIKMSAKESTAIEDQHLAEALARSASEAAMDTSGGGGGGSSGGSGGPSTSSQTPAQAVAAAAAATSAAAGGGGAATSDVKEQDVEIMVKMGFPRDRCIEELRRCDGDVNQAVAALFARSLSESFNKRK